MKDLVKNDQTELQRLGQEVTRWKVGVIFILMALPALYFGWLGVENDLPLSVDSTHWGTFGDFIGGVLNPIIAFCAFYWLVRSVIIQKTELEATKEALQASQEAQRDQARTLEHQRFDTTFFALLQQHNIVLAELSREGPDSKEGLRKFLIPQRHQNFRFIHGRSFRCVNLAAARAMLVDSSDVCGHYFRLLYQILKYIATKCPNSTVGPIFNAEALERTAASPDEKLYANIVRSFLPNDVTQLLAVNTAVDDKYHSYYLYKLLVERYSLLEHMPFKSSEFEEYDSILIELALFFNKRAFGKSEFIPVKLLNDLRD